MTLPVLGHDEEGFEILSVFDPRRCRCQLGHCGRPGLVEGLCDRCWLEYAALRNTYLVQGEWH